MFRFNRWLQTTCRRVCCSNDLWHAPQSACLSRSGSLQAGSLPSGEQYRTSSLRFYSVQRWPAQLHRSVSFLIDYGSIQENASGIFLFSGQKYGILETKIVLANLMRRFRFSVADSSQPMIIPSSEIVLKPKHGVPLIVSKR